MTTLLRRQANTARQCFRILKLRSGKATSANRGGVAACADGRRGSVEKALDPARGGDAAALEEFLVVLLDLRQVVAVAHHHAVGLLEPSGGSVGEPEDAIDPRAVVQVKVRDGIERVLARFFLQEVACANTFGSH